MLTNEDARRLRGAAAAYQRLMDVVCSGFVRDKSRDRFKSGLPSLGKLLESFSLSLRDVSNFPQHGLDHAFVNQSLLHHRQVWSGLLQKSLLVFGGKVLEFVQVQSDAAPGELEG